MYHANGTYYTEEHTVSFGDVSNSEFQVYANTWTDWHLIPSSRPAIANPTIVTKFIEIPGADGMLDLTTYLTGRPVYGQRQGSLSFIIDNDHEHWETIRMNMVRILHGKRLKVRLDDNPEWYYEGRFTVGNLESGSDHSNISITYQLDPYKFKIRDEGSTPMLWDPFNFETDYDYYTAWPGGSDAETTNIGAGTYHIYAGDYAFTPVVTSVSGSVTVKLNNNSSHTISSGSVTLEPVDNGENTLVITGSGKCNITWKRGAL